MSRILSTPDTLSISQIDGFSSGAMKQALIDYYRCPENLADFRLAGTPFADSGYFRFGPETICYGRLSSRPPSKQLIAPLHDSSTDVTADGGVVCLSIDPDEIIENLRHERYRDATHSNWTRFTDSPLVRNTYYRFRPFLPLSVRKHLQRALLKDWTTLAFPHWPVDRTVERLLEQLLALSMAAQGADTVPFVWFWPDGASSCAIMTHDIETLAGRNFSSQLMDLDDSVGIKASFQIVPEGRYPVPSKFVDEIRHRGFEINIHDLNHDGLLFASRERFQRRAVQINAYGVQYRALGFRSGGLYRNPAWYTELEFSYDMSLPSVAHLDPQRGGCCSLMPFFIGKILELPLTTIQDYSLFHVLNDYSIDLWKRQLASVTDAHGLASFLVHPDYLIDGRARKTYQTLLEHLALMREERNIWIAPPRDVDRWWRERNQMRVVCHEGKWRIEGRGREHARLAFATLVGRELSFTISDHN
jgi:hypothetical protein